MSKFKEVWYVWDDGQKGDKYKMSDGSVLSYEKIGGAIMQTGSNEILDHIKCYTLGEKRRRVDCPDCKDSRFAGMVYCGGYFEYRDCHTCNGTGKVWEYEK